MFDITGSPRGVLNGIAWNLLNFGIVLMLWMRVRQGRLISLKDSSWAFFRKPDKLALRQPRSTQNEHPGVLHAAKAFREHAMAYQRE